VLAEQAGQPRAGETIFTIYSCGSFAMALSEFNLLTSLAALAYNRYRMINRERWYRRVIAKKQSTSIPGFFDSYPRFLETSQIESLSQINYRHRYMIERNTALIKGQRILDIASHDGRFSFAAAKAGAYYVRGIEARPHLVRAAVQNMEAYGAQNVEFMCGDVLAQLEQINEPFDTIFCFGFPYHTLDHMPLLRKIARLRPKCMILDTEISLHPESVIEVREEGVKLDIQGTTGEPGDPDRTIVGSPSRTALNTMLKACGFTHLEYLDWHALKIDSWNDIKSYYVGQRTTVTAYRKIPYIVVTNSPPTAEPNRFGESLATAAGAACHHLHADLHPVRVRHAWDDTG